ncbi:MAG TPA: hypothetical protein VGK40_05005 [Verrucomicrobiae bacterium]|jgi:hypothetical protein
MKSRFSFTVLAVIASTVVASAAPTGSTIVRERINSVSVSSGANATPGAAVVNEVMQGPKCIRTGADSRAHLELQNGLLRVGADSLLTIEGDGATLERGSVVYGYSPGSHFLQAKLGNRGVTVSGDTGFMYLAATEKGGALSLRVGAISGRSTVQVGSDKYTLEPADLLTLSADGAVVVTQFDLGRQVKTAVLINGFEQPLPNLQNIQHESAKFATLQGRGFVRPVTAADESTRLVKGSPLSEFDSGIQSLANRNASPRPGGELSVRSVPSLGGAVTFFGSIPNGPVDVRVPNSGGTFTREQIELLIEAQRLKNARLPFPTTPINSNPSPP